MRILLAGLYGGLRGAASGTETYTRLLATELSRRGHAVTVASRSPGDEPRTRPATAMLRA